MAVVRRGRVSSSVEGEGGRRCVVEIVRAGGECGLTSVVDGGEHAFTDAALDRSVVALVPAEPVREAMARDPQFALRVARALSSDAHHAQALCADLTCRSPMERLARYLGERTSGREVFELRDTQRQIAAQLGTVREVVAVVPLMVLMLVTGLYPNWIMPVINNGVSQFLGLLGG